MHRERDHEDARLMAQGAYGVLLATYYPVMRDRLRARRLPPQQADDILQQACVRLLGELRSGRTYRVPFRVVVHNVLDWTRRGWSERREDLLPEEWDAGADDDALRRVEEEHDLELRIAGLPPREQDVVRRRYGRGEAIEEIAADLGISRNAVDQALFRAHRRLRGAWDTS